MSESKNEEDLMELSRFDLLKILDKKDIGDDAKAATKKVFKQKYGDEWLIVSAENVNSFMLDLKYLAHFGDTHSKLRLNFTREYLTTLAYGIEDSKLNATELVIQELPRKANLSKRENHIKPIHEFMAKLNQRFPNLQCLVFAYMFCCEDCPYFDGLIQPFASLTDIELHGRVKFSEFMNFIGQNPQLEKVAVVYNNKMICPDGKKFCWKLPADFVQRLNSALPKLNCLRMLLPCVMKEPQHDIERYLKHLEMFVCGLHGPNSWMPDLSAISGNKMEKLTLQLAVEDIVDDFFKKSKHLKRLKEVTIDAYLDPVKYGLEMPLVSANILHSFILSHVQLNKITIRTVAFVDGDLKLRAFDNPEDEQDECEELQRIYHQVIQNKLNGHQWSLAGYSNELKFSKNDS